MGWRACSRSWERAAKRCSARQRLTERSKWWAPGAAGAGGVFREDQDFHGLAKGEKGETAAGSFDGYEPLVAAIMTFFQTGVAPVKAEETIEIIAFMEAADESKNKGGAPMKLRLN